MTSTDNESLCGTVDAYVEGKCEECGSTKKVMKLPFGKLECYLCFFGYSKEHPEKFGRHNDKLKDEADESEHIQHDD